MSILEYLEIVTTIFNNYFKIINQYYDDCKFSVNKYGTRPICFTVVNGELGLVVRKNVYNLYDREPKTTNVISKFYKSSLSDNYNCEESGIYSLNNQALKDAINYFEKSKKKYIELSKRIQFYYQNQNIIIEFENFIQKQPRHVISIEVGIRNASHLSIDIEKRYFETVDSFTIDMLKEIIIPKDKISEEIWKLMENNNFNIQEFTPDELIIHKWHNENPPQPSRNYENIRKRGYGLW